MTQEELRKELENGKMLKDLFDFSLGQDCIIYKADKFEISDNIIYIPDIFLNDISISKVLNEEEIEDALHHCTTGYDFLEEAREIENIAESIFDYVDWQHPNAEDWVGGYDEDIFRQDYGISIEDFLDGKINEYEVEIVETYRRKIKVRSTDQYKAYDVVEEMVNNGDIDLPCDGGKYDYSRELYVEEVK